MLSCSSGHLGHPERLRLATLYGWHQDDTDFQLLHQGENDTFLVRTRGMRYILRRYRRERYREQEILAELAWMCALRNDINVPNVIANTAGDFATRLVGSDGERLYAVFEFIEGESPERPSSEDYRRLGELMKALHSGADAIMQSKPEDWALNRPVYDIQRAVREPLRHLLQFDLLSEENKRRCVSVAEELEKRFRALEPDRRFIHADLHFGNIVVREPSWCCLDFDECGYGHRALDLGVVKLHLKNRPDALECWAHFKHGYGDMPSQDALAVGTAARIFYMAGKIPMRQDIESLRHNPDARIGKYLTWIEDELA